MGSVWGYRTAEMISGGCGRTRVEWAELENRYHRLAVYWARRFKREEASRRSRSRLSDAGFGTPVGSRLRQVLVRVFGWLVSTRNVEAYKSTPPYHFDRPARTWR